MIPDSLRTALGDIDTPADQVRVMEALLLIWGEWARQGHWVAGYPMSAAFAELKVQVDSVRLGTDFPQWIEAIERVVAALSRRDKSLIKKRYLARYPDHVIAVQLNLSTEQFVVRCRSLHYRLAEKLGLLPR